MKKILIFSMIVMALIMVNAPVSAQVADDPFCVAKKIVIDSSIDTQNAGFTNNNPTESYATDPIKYETTWGNSELYWNPAYIDPDSDVNLSGAEWISTIKGGLEGDYKEYQWALYKHDLDLPENAKNIIGTVYYTADNDAAVFFDGAKLDSTKDIDIFTSELPVGNPYIFQSVWTTDFAKDSGTDALYFVVRNWGWDDTNNPSALVYTAVINYCEDMDMDDDGVLDTDDECLGTEDSDHWFTYNTQGVNRWSYDYKAGIWRTIEPKGKGKPQGPKASYTIADTLGCNCTQILDRIKKATGDNMEGHYKYGCSKSVLDEWISGEYYLETVNVPSNETFVTTTKNIMESEDYILKASGTYKYATWEGDPRADAKCSYGGIGDPLHRMDWLNGNDLPTGFKNYLEVRVNKEVVDWGVSEHACNADNKYEMGYPGADSFSFNIYDGGSIGDNSGYIPVAVYVKLW